MNFSRGKKFGPLLKFIVKHEIVCFHIDCHNLHLFLFQNLFSTTCTCA